MVDPFEMAEGEGALDRLIEQRPPKEAKQRRKGDLKADWKPTNIRMSPRVKERMKAQARALGVPLEELVHVAMTRFLGALDAGEIELETRAATVKKTLL